MIASTLGRVRKALSQITCSNYIEKGYYPRNCSELKRDASED